MPLTCAGSELVISLNHQCYFSYNSYRLVVFFSKLFSYSFSYSQLVEHWQMQVH